MIGNLFAAHPLAAYLLLFIPLFLIGYYYLWLVKIKARTQFAPDEITEKLLKRDTFFWLKAALLCLIWFFLTLALMQPMGYGEYAHKTSPTKGFQEERKIDHRITLLIDASHSMNAQDGFNKKRRLETAKEITNTLLTNLKGNAIALYAFTDQLIELSPSTYDSLYLTLMTRQLEVNEGGAAATDLLETLKNLEKHYEKEPRHVKRTLILFTDGEETVDQAINDPQRESLLLTQVMQMKKDYHFDLFVIGIGSDKGVDIPNITFEGKPVHSSLKRALLEKIAKAAGGTFIDASATSSQSTAKALAVDKQEIKQKDPFLKGTNDLIHINYAQIPLLIGLILLAIKKRYED